MYILIIRPFFFFFEISSKDRGFGVKVDCVGSGLDKFLDLGLDMRDIYV